MNRIDPQRLPSGMQISGPMQAGYEFILTADALAMVIVADAIPDDDVVARGRKFGRLGAKVVQALETTPVSVRIDFTD